MDHQQSIGSPRLPSHSESEGRVPAAEIVDRERGRALALGYLAAFAPRPTNPFHVLSLSTAWQAGYELKSSIPVVSSGRHSPEYLKAVA